MNDTKPTAPSPLAGATGSATRPRCLWIAWPYRGECGKTAHYIDTPTSLTFCREHAEQMMQLHPLTELPPPNH